MSGAGETFRYEEAFYAPVSEAAPGGAALEEHTFFAIGSIARWPLNDFGNLDATRAPDFAELRREVHALLQGTGGGKATRDVRALTALVLAETGLHGPVGLARSLDLLHHWLTDGWPHLHPDDEDGEGEFEQRMDALQSGMDPPPLTRALEGASLLKLPRIGALTLRVLMVTQGKARARENEPTYPAPALAGALAAEEAASATLGRHAEALTAALATLDALTARLAQEPDLFITPDFSAFAKTCRGYLDVLAPHAAPIDGPGGEAEDAEGGDEGTPVRAAPKSALKDRAEAIALLKASIGYYVVHEPGSPVTLALIAVDGLMDASLTTWLDKTAGAGIGRMALKLNNYDENGFEPYRGLAAPATSAAQAPDLSGIGEALCAAVDDLRAGIAEPWQPPGAAPPHGGGEHEGEEGDAAEGPAPEGAAPEEAALAEIERLRAVIDRAARAGSEALAMLPGAPDEEDGDAAEGAPGPIATRLQALDAIEQVAAFITECEPSSPAPLFLRRIVPLGGASFTEIAGRLVPSDENEARLFLHDRQSR